MERDWVIIAADQDGMAYDLTHLNSSMRRIDLICKLIAPILISVVVSATSVKSGVLVVGGMSLLSWGIEIWCARHVWMLNPKLQALKSIAQDESVLTGVYSSPLGFSARVVKGIKAYAQDFEKYFSSIVWAPSLSLAFLHLSALSYGATFITYLLSIGISLDLITIARAAGSIIEISSTVVTPLGVYYLGKAVNHGHYRGVERSSDATTTLLDERADDDLAVRTETGLERLGLWGISWQFLNLVSTFTLPLTATDILIAYKGPVVFALWFLGSGLSLPLPMQHLLSFTLFFFLSISRLGLWIYDLTTQQLTQTLTQPSQRSSFTGVEYSFVALFELAQHVVTIILHRPEQFRWIALGSYSAVGISTLVYAAWVWRVRGHLVHWESIGKGCGKCVGK
jgi:iron-regulated transporter 1